MEKTEVASGVWVVPPLPQQYCAEKTPSVQVKLERSRGADCKGGTGKRMGLVRPGSPLAALKLLSRPASLFAALHICCY